MATLNYVFWGVHGSVVALDKTTGAQVWGTKLKGWDFVNLIWTENELYATTKGEIFCLDSGTGQVLWHNPLKRTFGVPALKEDPVSTGTDITIPGGR